MLDSTGFYPTEMSDYARLTKGKRPGGQWKRAHEGSRVESCEIQRCHWHLREGIMANSRNGFVASRDSSFLLIAVNFGPCDI